MPDYQHAPGIAQPRALHTNTEAAEKARQAVRDFSARRNAEREAPPALVTEHLKPWVFIDLEELTGSARLFAIAATEADHVVDALRAGDAVEVRVNRGVIRAWWKAGRTTDAVLSAGGVSRVVPITLATYTLTMPLADATARYQRESDERKAKAAETRAAKAAAA